MYLSGGDPLFIQEIKLTNFRFYSNPTVIQFDHRMTMVKDNTTYDGYNALTWAVMNRWGKSEVQHQTELLFAGDSFSAPATYMEVMVSIDNNRAFLPIPNFDLSIKRRYYRAGRSKFFMDGLGCRLKDITNLLQEHLHP